MDVKDPYTLFGLAFGFSALAGLASLLRVGTPISYRKAASTILNAGLFGCGIAMVWYEWAGGATRPWLMLGLSLLGGLGGPELIEVFFQSAKEGLRLYITRAANTAAIPTAPTQPQYPPPYQPGPYQPIPPRPLPPGPAPRPLPPAPYTLPDDDMPPRAKLPIPPPQGPV